MVIQLPQIPQQITGVRGFQAPRVFNPANPGAAQTVRLGRAMLSSGIQLSRAATAVKDRIDYTQAKKGQALANERVADASRAFKNLVGSDVTPDRFDRAWEVLSKEVEEIGKGLENPVQRTLFQSSMQSSMLATRQSWAAHLDEQSKVAAVGMTETALDGKLDATFGTALTFARSIGRSTPEEPAGEVPPGEDIDDGMETGGGFGGETAFATGGAPVQDAARGHFEFARASVREEANTLAKMLGWPDEVRDKYIRDKLTKVHEKVVDKLIDEGAMEQARGYIEHVSEDISNYAKGSFEITLDRAEIRGDGQTAAAMAAAEVDGDYRDALASTPGVEATEDAEARSETLLVEGLENLRGMGLQPRVLEEAERDLRKRARERHEKEMAGRAEARRYLEQQLREDLTATADTLPESDKRLMRKHDLLTTMRNFENSTGRYGTMKEFFYELYDNPAILRGIETLREFDDFVNGKLDPSAKAQAQALWERARGATPTTELAGWTTHLMEGARKLNILTRTGATRARGATDPAKSEKFYRYRVYADAKLADFERRKRGKATEAEMQQIITTITKDQVKVDIEWETDPEVSRFTLVDSPDLEKAYLERDTVVEAFRALHPGTEVPAILADLADPEVFLKKFSREDRGIINERLQAEGRPITEANTLARWFFYKAYSDTLDAEGR